MDSKTREITDTIEAFTPYAAGVESPMQYTCSPNADKFVYVVNDIPNWYSKFKEEFKLGIYIYDIKSRTKKRIVDNGRYATWCPDSNLIAYYNPRTHTINIYRWVLKISNPIYRWVLKI